MDGQLNGPTDNVEDGDTQVHSSRTKLQLWTGNEVVVVVVAAAVAGGVVTRESLTFL